MLEAKSFTNKTKALLFPLVCTLFLVLLSGSPAYAQSIHDPVDLHFKVVNGTTGGPGTLDRLQIQYRTSTLQPVIDITPDGSDLTLRNVPIKEIGQYIITAWKNGVPYFGQHRGSKLIEEEITLHVFDTTTSCNDIKISGLTLLVKKSGSVLTLEYMININNAATPQITVLGNPTFELKLPLGFSQVKAEYRRGPDPIAIAVSQVGNNSVGLTVPFTSGGTAISLTALVPFTEAMELPIIGDMPVDTWSLMTFPNNLVADSFELESEAEADHGMEGWNRYLGQPLPADHNLVIRLNSGPKGGPQKNLFSPSENEQPEEHAESTTDTDNEDKDKFPWIPVGLVTILAIVMAVKRRRR